MLTLLKKYIYIYLINRYKHSNDTKMPKVSLLKLDLWVIPGLCCSAKLNTAQRYNFKKKKTFQI